MLSKDEQCLLMTLPIFDGVDSKSIDELVNASYVLCYERGERILSVMEEKSFLGILLSGTACVIKGSVQISTLTQGSTFGAAMLFCSDKGKVMPTTITAKKQCRVLCVAEDVLLSALTQNEQFLYNYLGYQNERIRFLVGKVALFSASHATEKLYKYIAANARAQEDEKYRAFTPKSYSALAESIGVGRATLYRALFELEEQGIITRKEKTIVLLEQKSCGE